jgi:hypothetical protein
VGYDMRWRKPDADEAEAVAVLRTEFYAACNVRDALPRSEAGVPDGALVAAGASLFSDEAYVGRTPRWSAAQDQVLAASRAVDEAENSYFRLNIGGMSRYMGLMDRLGMVFEDDPHPPFPEAEDYGTTWDDVYAAESPEDYPGHEWTDSRLVAALKVKEASDAVLSFHGRADTPGIPEHKFSSNDGWIVLPVECEAAVRAWREFVADEGDGQALAIVAEHVGDTGYWLKWIAYLAGAARHDGFEVH